MLDLPTVPMLTPASFQADRNSVSRLCAHCAWTVSYTHLRVQQLYLTEKAEALLPRILDVFSRWEEVLTRGFSEEEKAQARDLLSRMYLNAEAEVQQQSSPLIQPEYTNEPAEKRDGQ